MCRHKTFTSFIARLTFVVFTAFFSLQAGHNTSRYFHFLEKPSTTTVRSRWSLFANTFITSASTAFDREGGNAGIPELFGKYDLKDVIDSLRVCRLSQGKTFTNPFLQTAGVEGLANRSIIYLVDGRVRSTGFALDGCYNFLDSGFYIGFNWGFNSVNTQSKYTLSRGDGSGTDTTDPVVQDLLPGEIAQLERVRLDVHNQLCLCQKDSDTTGLTDLDLFVRWHHFLDHKFLMRSINFNLIGGIVIPTSQIMPLNNPTGVPIMGNGHFGFYFDIHPEFELKPNWNLGIQLSFMYQTSSTEKRRFPILDEPANHSALIGEFNVNPGSTFKVAPYFRLDNLVDGLHFQARYAYLRHNGDSWSDRRTDQTTPSILTPSELRHVSSSVTEQMRCESLQKHLRRTSWRSTYYTLSLMYEPKEAQSHWPLDPVFYIHYDIPAEGKGVAKTHHLWFGAQLRF